MKGDQFIAEVRNLADLPATRKRRRLPVRPSRPSEST
jgi:hypothetical protein